MFIKEILQIHIVKMLKEITQEYTNNNKIDENSQLCVLGMYLHSSIVQI